MGNCISVDIRGLHFKVADFVGPVPFHWHSSNKVSDIGILVLRRVCDEIFLIFIKLDRDNFH